MNRAEKYIRFVEVANPGKTTKRWEVQSLRTSEMVGRIGWYGGWRKFVFSPADYTYFDSDGLRLIADFCDARTREHMSGVRSG